MPVDYHFNYGIKLVVEVKRLVAIGENKLKALTKVRLFWGYALGATIARVRIGEDETVVLPWQTILDVLGRRRLRD